MNPQALVLFLAVSTSAAAAPAEHPHPPAEYAPLEGFVGNWTTLGRESQFHEVCEWYAGKFHVICNARSKRPDGSTGHGMSILSFVPGGGYVYSGIGSNGRYETFSGGRWSEGTFIFESREAGNGASAINRIAIGPFTETGFLFVVSTSEDGVSWAEVGRTTYLRLR